MPAAEPAPPPPIEPPREPSRLARKYPVGQRDRTVLVALVSLAVGALAARYAIPTDDFDPQSPELGPILGAAHRAFPGEDDRAALRKLGARLDEQYPKGTTGEPGPRGISAAQRKAMVDTLKAESGAIKKAWIAVQATNAEAVSFQKWMVAVFQEAGWQVETSSWPGGGLKPGVFFFAAEEENPSFVETAQRALDAAGIKATAAIGYRAYYKEMKEKNPSWAGIDMKGDQAYAIVIGPKDEAKPAP
ncbi:MAG: hypothetical protein U0359_36065 [Byssovorax sp.]